jgi:MFS family permease
MDRKVTAYTGIIVCSTAALFYWFQYLTSTLPSITVRQLMHHFHASAIQIGFINASYFYTFFIFLFICGPIIDRFSAKKIIAIACAVCAVSTYTSVLSHNIILSCFSRAAMGASSAFAYPAMLYLIETWLDSRWFTLYASILTASAEIFILFFNLAVAVYLSKTSLSSIHISLAILGLVFAAISFFLIRNKPAQQQAQNHDPAPPLLTTIRLLFTNSQFIILLLITLFFFVSTAIFSASWGVEFSKAALGFSSKNAVFLNAALFGGIALGTIFFGLLGDWLKYRKWQILGSATLSLLVLGIILFAKPLNFPITVSLFSLLGFLMGTSINVYYYAKKICPQGVIATGMAIVTAISNISFMILPPLIGWILDSHWHGTLSHGARVFSRGAFQEAFIVAPLSYIVVIGLTFFLKE